MPLQFQEHYPLTQLNTFGVEAAARWYVVITDAQQLPELADSPIFRDNKRMVLGGGSNVLFTQDYPGLVIHIMIPGVELKGHEGDSVWVKAGGGVVWHPFVLHCLEQGWYGLENLSLIPGTVGAAPVQNIGAYGVELDTVFHSLEAFDMATGMFQAFSKRDCFFSYRDSLFKRDGKGRYIITSVTFRLTTNPVVNTTYDALASELEKRTPAASGWTPLDIAEAVIAVRRSKLPDPKELGNAGSFFKNPVVSRTTADALRNEHPGLPVYAQADGVTYKLAAGWLIEQCGWKGKRQGNVGVHARQALVLVNYGGARGEEVLALATAVQADVRTKFGVELEMEVNRI